jgi:8-oxo-dGTP diphosphatase
MNSPSITVVALVLVDSQKKMFLAKRPQTKGGEWEFPGGKKEPNEDLQEALVREIKEELSIQIFIDQELGQQAVIYNNKNYLIHFFLSYYKGQDIKLTEHEDSAWFSYSDLNSIKVSPGNLEFIKKNDLLKQHVCL